MIREFLKSCGLGHLPMTCVKKTEFTHFVDDKAYKVVPNKGEIETFLDL